MEHTFNTPKEEVLGTIPWEKFPLLKGEIENTMKGDATLNLKLEYELPDGPLDGHVKAISL